jgi:flavin reductase (DIM6/NTAB) family NADH-FMN oxidoreductase RutF
MAQATGVPPHAQRYPAGGPRGHLSRVRGVWWSMSFRAAMNAAVTGVTVVTTQTQGRALGRTVTSMCHIADEPPTLLVALPAGELADAIVARGAFAVNVLADHQAELAEHFRAKAPTFAARHWWPFGPLPLLQGAAARFECTLEHTHPAGPNLLLIGAVKRAQRGNARPLAYTRRGYSAPLAA